MQTPITKMQSQLTNANLPSIDFMQYKLDVILNCQQCLQINAGSFYDYVKEMLVLLQRQLEINFYKEIMQYDYESLLHLQTAGNLVCHTLCVLMRELDAHTERDTILYDLLRDIGILTGFVKSRKKRTTAEQDAMIDAYSDPAIAAIVETTKTGIKTRNSFYKKQKHL